MCHQHTDISQYLDAGITLRRARGAVLANELYAFFHPLFIEF